MGLGHQIQKAMKEPTKEIKMDLSTARQLVKQIKQSIGGISDSLWRLKNQEGWKTLGYDSWRECVTKEFNFSQSRAYELLESAEISRQISDASEKSAELTSRQTRALSVVEPEKRKEVWEAAKAKTGTDNPPAAAIEEVINDLPPEPPTEKEPPPKPPAKDTKLAEAAKMVKGNQLLEKTAYNLEELLAHWPEMKPQVAIVLRKYLAMVEKNPSNVLPLERKEA